MRIALVVLALSFAGCVSSLPELTADANAEIRKAADSIEVGLTQLRAEIQPYAQAATAACLVIGPDTAICRKAESLAGKLIAAMDQVQQGINDYRQAKIPFERILALMTAAVDVAEDYARAAVAAHAAVGHGA